MFSKSLNRKKTKTYLCSCCGKRHAGLSMNWSFNTPAYWEDEFAGKDQDHYFLNEDICFIDGKDFFVRGVIEIPVIDGDQTFGYGVWVSLSKENFKKYVEVFGTKKELKEKPYFGWLSNQLSWYPDTLGIKTHVHLQGNKLRPKIELDHDNAHPLCQEQHNGITMERVHEIIGVIEKDRLSYE